MTDASFNAGAADLWGRLMFPWSQFAPQALSQPINPGWSFGNVIVNEKNSSAPQTEQTILAEESYGRQIGKLLEAVHQLIQAQPAGGAGVDAFSDIAALRAKVERLKQAAAARRIDQLKQDLELLRAHDPEAFEAQAAGLRAILNRT